MNTVPDSRADPAGWLTARLGGPAFGGDYNPEQFADDPAVRREDEELMRRAGVNLVTLNVFGWAELEPEPGRYDFAPLDARLERLHAAGVAVDLATPTAQPPPWFGLAHPDALPVTPDGTRLTHGSRDTYCLAAPAYRQAARAVAEALAARYGEHPAVALWHVHNEYATVCHCEHAADAFRRWLRERYGTLEAVNRAWGTAFWSQRYGAWEQIQPPRATQWRPNPGQVLDFRRFWSDLALTAYRKQRDAIRAHSRVPVTTNVMLPGYQVLDLWAFGREVDLVGVDHYPDAPGLDAAADTAFGADRARSFGGGRPWLLIEQATSTVYAGDLVLPKEPGDILRHSLSHIARGSEGVLFFQWRQSPAGAEIWHSAMVPHAGPDTRIFRETVETGRAVAALAEVTGSTVRARAAVLHDPDVWWALDTPVLPTPELPYLPALKRAHRALWDAGITTDFAHPSADLSAYRLVLAPSLHLVSEESAAALTAYVEGGGTLLVECFSGAVDPHYRAWPGGAPGPLRPLLGLRAEEFRPLPSGAAVPLTDGGAGTTWTEALLLEGATAEIGYAEGPLTGRAAVTRHAHGRGTAWYASTRLSPASYTALIGGLIRASGAEPELPGLPAGVEAVRRHSDDGRAYLFLLNHSPAEVRVPVRGHDLLASRALPSEGAVLPPASAVVVREEG
ncbi:beta-galactosidase [Streptomyces sp. NPDC093221]|uniref:beta-galactosidase n=1 Tax=Streptomyces sp. NPDC093221 TaxID=3366032 RepID=UPI00380A92AE